MRHLLSSPLQALSRGKADRRTGPRKWMQCTRTYLPALARRSSCPVRFLRSSDRNLSLLQDPRHPGLHHHQRAGAQPEPVPQAVLLHYAGQPATRQSYCRRGHAGGHGPQAGVRCVQIGEGGTGKFDSQSFRYDLEILLFPKVPEL